MDKIQCTHNIQSSITVISNQFIDKYMLKAEGEFVKVYLLLLRLMNQGMYTGPEQIADMLDLMHKDVLRALNYWEKVGLITRETPEVTTTPTDSSQSSPETNSSGIPNVSDSFTRTPVHSAPAKINISPSEMKSAIDGTDLAQTCYMAEAYIGHPLSHKEITTFYYIENQLHFSAELLEYLIEYCITRGKKSVRYMESVAIAWFEEGIDTVQKAKEQSSSYNQNVFAILKAFGISNRNPAPAEMEFIQRWNNMGFDTEIIVEACNRTMLATHQASFPYAERILKQWQNQGVRTLKDIEKLDQNFHANKPAVSVTTTAGPAPKKATGNGFHNFDQRSYDYDDLEAKLRNLKNPGNQ